MIIQGVLSDHKVLLTFIVILHFKNGVPSKGTQKTIVYTPHSYNAVERFGVQRQATCLHFFAPELCASVTVCAFLRTTAVVYEKNITSVKNFKTLKLLIFLCWLR